MRFKFRIFDIEKNTYVLDDIEQMYFDNEGYYIVEQYIGREDVDGNEIFEGDLVKVFDYSVKNYITGKIEYDKESLSYKLKLENGFLIPITYDRIKIIGKSKYSLYGK